MSPRRARAQPLRSPCRSAATILADQSRPHRATSSSPSPESPSSSSHGAVVASSTTQLRHSPNATVSALNHRDAEVRTPVHEPTSTSPQSRPSRPWGAAPCYLLGVAALSISVCGTRSQGRHTESSPSRGCRGHDPASAAAAPARRRWPSAHGEVTAAAAIPSRPHLARLCTKPFHSATPRPTRTKDARKRRRHLGGARTPAPDLPASSPTGTTRSAGVDPPATFDLEWIHGRLGWKRRLPLIDDIDYRRREPLLPLHRRFHALQWC